MLNFLICVLALGLFVFAKTVSLKRFITSVAVVVYYRRSLNDLSQPECTAAKWPFSTLPVLQKWKANLYVILFG